MEDEVAVAAIDQQVLAAPTHRSHGAARKAMDILRYRPAQARLVHGYRRYDAADEARRETSTGHFHFR